MAVFFLLKTTLLFKNTETYQKNNQENSGLTYNSTATLEDLVNKDTDGDGILDWKESLYGLDPTKKETTPGVPDSVAIKKLSAQDIVATDEKKIEQNTENLTQTEKFSRELFAIVATASQNGIMDETAIDKLSTSLAEQIQNPVARKVYAISDIKIKDIDTKQAIQKYSDALDSVYAKANTEKGVIAVLEEFMADEENADILSELDPIINQAERIINESLQIQVPQSLSILHLNLINASEGILENISDMRLLDSDPIIAISAISQYEKNIIAFKESAVNLLETIRQKLNN